MSLSTKDKQGIGLLIAVFIVALIIIGINVKLSSRPKADERNCVGPVSRKTVFLIDQSDAIPEQTAAEIKSRALKLVSEAVEDNELVSVFFVTSQSRTQLVPVFSACKPPEEGSELSDNVRAIKKRFDEGFLQPLQRALAAPPPKTNASPIGEVIVDISLGDYLRAPNNRLVVYSDLLQNSGNTSLYSCSDASSAIQEFRAHRAGAVERPVFKNTEIQLNFIPREGLSGQVAECRTKFWTWFFGDNEGAKSSLQTDFLPGGAKIK